MNVLSILQPLPGAGARPTAWSKFGICRRRVGSRRISQVCACISPRVCIIYIYNIYVFTRVMCVLVEGFLWVSIESYRLILFV